MCVWVESPWRHVHAFWTMLEIPAIYMVYILVATFHTYSTIICIFYAWDTSTHDHISITFQRKITATLHNYIQLCLCLTYFATRLLASCFSPTVSLHRTPHKVCHVGLRSTFSHVLSISLRQSREFLGWSDSIAFSVPGSSFSCNPTSCHLCEMPSSPSYASLSMIGFCLKFWTWSWNQNRCCSCNRPCDLCAVLLQTM